MNTTSHELTLRGHMPTSAMVGVTLSSVGVFLVGLLLLSGGAFLMAVAFKIGGGIFPWFPLGLIGGGGGLTLLVTYIVRIRRTVRRFEFVGDTLTFWTIGSRRSRTLFVAETTLTSPNSEQGATSWILQHAGVRYRLTPGMVTGSGSLIELLRKLGVSEPTRDLLPGVGAESVTVQFANLKNRPSPTAILRATVLNDEMFGMALFGGIISMLPLLFSIPMLWREAQFQLDGVTIRGSVLQKQIAGENQPGPVMASVLAHGGGRRGPRHLVEYEYLDDAGTRHTGRSSVSTAIWQQLVVGGPVNVIYLKSQPAHSRVVGAATTPLGLIIGLFVFGVMVLAGTVRAIVIGIRRLLLNLELFQYGEPALAVVRSVDVVAGRKQRTRRTLQYSYEAAATLAGSPVEYNGTCEGTGRRGSTCRAEDRLLLFFDATEPQRHALDVYGLCDELLRSAGPDGV